MLVGVERQALLMGAPAELGGLQPLADEAGDAPGVDELAGLLRLAGHLRVMLGNVNDLEADFHRQPCPLLARLRLLGVLEVLLRHFQERCLDEVADEAGIGPHGQQRGGRALRPFLGRLERRVAQEVVAALMRGNLRVVVVAGPRLDAGVEIEDAMIVAPFDDIEARDIDAEVEHEVALADIAAEHLRHVALGDRLDTVFDALLHVGTDLLPMVVGLDDGDAVHRHVEMLGDQRHRAMPHRAIADHQDAAVELELLCCHG
jgi:hypothetical protein